MSNNNQAYSVNEFCKLQGISPSFFYKLQRQGKAPKTMLVGARRLIPSEAIAIWQKDMEAE